MLNSKKTGLLFWGLVFALTAFACATITGESDGGASSAGTATPNLTLTAVFAPTQEQDPILELEPLPTEDLSEVETPTPVDAPQGDSGEPLGSADSGDEETSLQEMPVVEAVELIFEEPEATGEATPEGTPGETETFPTTEQRLGPSVVANYLSEFPNMDGDPRDWDATWYKAEKVVFGPEFYADKDDLSSVFKVGWDEEFLYIGLIVYDSAFVQNATGSQIWRGDSLEILLDVDLSGDFTTGLLNNDDYQFGFAPGVPKSKDVSAKPPAGYIWAPPFVAGPFERVVIASQLGLDGYMMEVAIPWFTMDMAPFEDMHLGFLLSVSDNDSINDTVQQSVVSFAPERVLHDPTFWRDLVLNKP